MTGTMDRKSKFRRIVKVIARVGTALCLMALVWSCGTVPGLREEEPGSFIRVPFVRVLLDESSSKMTIDADHEFAIECLAGGVQAVYYSSRPVTVQNVGSHLRVVNHSQVIIQDHVNEVNILPRGNGNRIRVGDKMYRGIMQFLPYQNNLRLVNIIYMEDYLRGVVPPELGRRTEAEIEAVKAQAVAARTYAMSHLQQYKGEPYDMKASIYDQVYEGVNVENRLVNQAIDATAGQVASYQDELINAYYHSTCGGQTDNINHVWDRAEIGYLKAVADHGACNWSKYYRWEEVFTEKQLRGRIEQYLSSDRGRDFRIGPIRGIEIIERTPGGRVAVLKVQAETDFYRFYKDRIRWVIGRTSNPDLILPSDRFDVIIDRDAAGAIRSVTFRGSGYGHGVGMCQCGAIGLAREGRDFDQILRHYYTGIEIKKLY